MSEINEQEVNVTENAAEPEKVVVEKVIERTVYVEKEAAPGLKANGCGIAGFIVGLIGLLTSFCGFGGLISLLGLILSITGLCQKKCRKGMAVAGLVVSIIGTLIGAFMLLGVGGGIFAPQMIKYTEKSNESSDMYLCETIKSAFETSLAQEDLFYDAIDRFAGDGEHRVSELKNTSVGSQMEEYVGMPVSDWENGLRSSNAIYFTLEENGVVDVYCR